METPELDKLLKTVETLRLSGKITKEEMEELNKGILGAVTEAVETTASRTKELLHSLKLTFLK